VLIIAFAGQAQMRSGGRNPISGNLRTDLVRPAAWRLGRRQRLVHDPPDRARAPPALGAAAETVIDFARRARPLLAGKRRADVVVGKHVTGTNDHRGKAPNSI